ncbi:ABC transporter permease subunit [Pseudogemmobacter sonorensis]|uniref:ABC transporter permease subunit n=1 Tax=Pseudogemmobacter sonorensis TaxID=2989681 RepID=UPI0036C38D64
MPQPSPSPACGHTTADLPETAAGAGRAPSGGRPAPAGRARLARAQLIEAIAIPLGALLAACLAFSVFLLALGQNPATFFALVWTGGFASAFSLQNSLSRAAPLILTGLAFAVPARIGMTLIGVEGALVLGGLAAAVLALPLVAQHHPPALVLPLMALGAMLTGAFWIGLAGWLRHFRGVNETISSLLLSYIAVAILSFLVEGAFRDPALANKPSTQPTASAPFPAARSFGGWSRGWSWRCCCGW